MPNLPAPPDVWLKMNHFGRLHFLAPNSQLQQTINNGPTPINCSNTPNLLPADGITGWATYYNPTGHKTASGQPYDPNALTAASPYIPGTTQPKYPFGSRMRVTSTAGQSVIVTITDTGSFGNLGFPGSSLPRVIDLSPAAMKIINPRGLTSIEVNLQAA